MFRLLFKSRHRSALLKIFFSNPQKKYYIRELAKIIHASAGNTQKELIKFEQDEILTSQKIGNLKFYSLNQAHPLYPELEKIVTKTIGIQSELQTNLKSLKGIKFAFIFGSYIKGDFKADSDIDLFIIGKVNEDDLIQKIKKSENSLQREINFHLAKPKDFLDNLLSKSFYQEIIKKNTLLIGQKDDFKEFVKNQ